MNARRGISLLAGILMMVPFAVLAQGTADGSVPPADQKPADATTPVDPQPTGSAPSSAGTASQGTQAPAGTQTPATGTTTSNPSTGGSSQPNPATGNTVPAPVTPQPAQATDLPGSAPTPDAIAEGAETSSNAWLWPAVAAAIFVLALIPFGFLIAGRLKKKPTESDDAGNRCFDIKQMMEEKLKELTDVKALIAEQAKEKAKEAVRDAVSGSATGDLLVKAEKLEEQYKKLRALFEECQIDVDNYALKGVLVENSMIDKHILKNLRIIRTRTEGDQVLHDVRISKKQIPDLQNNIVDKKWFLHFWAPGSDDVTVVFTDKVFTIKHSDKRTWEDAIVHGVMSGIPQAKLDFTIVK